MGLDVSSGRTSFAGRGFFWTGAALGGEVEWMRERVVGSVGRDTGSRNSQPTCTVCHMHGLDRNPCTTGFPLGATIVQPLMPSTEVEKS